MASPPFPSLTSVVMAFEDSRVRFRNEVVLHAIASEIASIATGTAHKSQQASTSDGSHVSSSSDKSADGRKSFDFRLESFLTRPRACKKLFPPHVQRERYSMISVQERLIMLSVEPSLTVDQEQSGDKDHQKEDGSIKDEASLRKGALLVAALEVLEYTLFPLNTDRHQDVDNADPSHSSPSCPIERILYISKVDSSGCWTSCGINTYGLKSPARALVSGYLKAMQLQNGESNSSSSSSLVKADSGTSETTTESTSETAQQMSSLKISSLPSKETDPDATPSIRTTEEAPNSDDLIERYHVKKTSIYVFARAQPQYLFRDSAKNLGKHVLGDRDLVRWWKNMIASTYGTQLNGIHSSDTVGSTDSQSLAQKPQENNKSTNICGWWLIPGIGTEREALRVIQSSHSLSPLTWTYGHPHKGSKEMAQSLIPQFPDDPKSRMMQSAMSNHGKVDIDTFWELAAIGEESGAGKITGYFRLDEEVPDKEVPAQQKKAQTETSSEVPEQKEKVKKKTTTTTTETLHLSAKITNEFKKVVSDLSIHVTSNMGGTTSDFTKVINKLLNLDFSDADVSVESTRRWRDYVDKWIERADESDAKQKQVLQEHQRSRKGNDPLIVPKVSSWIQREVVSVWLQPAEETGDPHAVVTDKGAIQTVQQPSIANASSTELIPPKGSESTITTQQPAAVNVLGAGLIKRKVPDPTATTQPPVVNVLSAGLIKRKAPASTPVAVQPSSPSSTVVDPSGSTATGAPESSTSAPVVNILGASFIKKRKIDP